MKIRRIIINSALALVLLVAILIALPSPADTPAAVTPEPDGEAMVTPTETTPPAEPSIDMPQSDFNKNGKPDYVDILEGARADALNMPTYDDSYFIGGYPPDDIGVCADVVWRAFKNAGYDLKSMMDADIKNRTEAYVYIEKTDPNIDFRRVFNQLIFFQTYAVALTNDVSQTSEWQTGDIVIFCNERGRPDHIGIISDRRTDDGTPLLIHNSGQAEREEDALRDRIIIAHFRFDASLVDGDILIKWGERSDG